MLLRGLSEKVLISPVVERKSNKRDCSVSLSNAEICNAIRSYEKRKDLAMFAKPPRLNHLF